MLKARNVLVKKMLMTKKTQINPLQLQGQKLLSENPDNFSDRLKLTIQQKQGRSDINRFDDEIVAIIDKILRI